MNSEQIEESAASATLSLLPEKSRKMYYKTYNNFKRWCESKNVINFNENVVLAYFNDEFKSYKPSTLWSYYSMLKSTILVEKDVDISKFSKVIAYLKRKNAGFKPKKSKILSREQIDKFLLEAPDELYLLTKVCIIFYYDLVIE